MLIRKKREIGAKKITWFNPLYNQFATVIIAIPDTLGLNFPKLHKLPNIFSRNTVKVNYSCIENVSSFI